MSYVIKDITHNDYVSSVVEIQPTKFELSFCKTKKAAKKFATEQSVSKAMMLIMGICPDDEFKIVEVKANE